MPFALAPYTETTHLPGSKRPRGDATRDAERMPAWPEGAIVVFEEKLDGTPCEVAFSRDGDPEVALNGALLDPDCVAGDAGRFAAWARGRRDVLFDALGARHVLCAEWCLLKHTVHYDRLRSFLNEFDVYDRSEGAFLDTGARAALLVNAGVTPVPVVWSGRPSTVGEVRGLLRPSAYRSDVASDVLDRASREAGADPRRTAAETMEGNGCEGLYAKVEARGRVLSRHKFVTAEFLAAIAAAGSHHARRIPVRNSLERGLEPWA